MQQQQQQQMLQQQQFVSFPFSTQASPHSSPFTFSVPTISQPAAAGTSLPVATSLTGGRSLQAEGIPKTTPTSTTPVPVSLPFDPALPMAGGFQFFLKLSPDDLQPEKNRGPPTTTTTTTTATATAAPTTSQLVSEERESASHVVPASETGVAMASGSPFLKVFPQLRGRPPLWSVRCQDDCLPGHTNSSRCVRSVVQHCRKAVFIHLRRLVGVHSSQSQLSGTGHGAVRSSNVSLCKYGVVHGTLTWSGI